MTEEDSMPLNDDIKSAQGSLPDPERTGLQTPPTKKPKAAYQPGDDVPSFKEGSKEEPQEPDED